MFTYNVLPPSFLRLQVTGNLSELRLLTDKIWKGQEPWLCSSAEGRAESQTHDGIGHPDVLELVTSSCWWVIERVLHLVFLMGKRLWFLVETKV